MNVEQFSELLRNLDACNSAADAADSASGAAYAAAYAANAAAYAAARAASLKQSAELVRARIPLAAIEAAATAKIEEKP